MLAAYINYPNPHITIHSNAGCATIQQQHKQGQRLIRLNVKTLCEELERFAEKHYRFGAEQGTNDMWLYVEFLDSAFERAVVEYVRKLLTTHYSPFGRITVSEHCA